MSKADYAMVLTYLGLCVGGLVLYKQFLDRAENSTVTPQEIFDHIDKVVEQKITEAMVRQVAEAQ